MCLGLAALPVGFAQMASNTVPPTYAGETEVPIAVTTVLVAGGPDDLGALSAQLTSAGQPISGLPIDFAVASAPGDPVCEDVATDAEGVARCNPGQMLGEQAVTYLVTFSGVGGLAAAADTLVIPGHPSPEAPEIPDVPDAPEAPEAPDPNNPAAPPSPSPTQPGEDDSEVSVTTEADDLDGQLNLADDRATESESP